MNQRWLRVLAVALIQAAFNCAGEASLYNDREMMMQETRDSIADIWGERTPYAGEWPVRVDEQPVDESEQWIQPACIVCSNCCGMDIGVMNGRMVGVRGREVDRVNHGRLGPKGLHGWAGNQ